MLRPVADPWQVLGLVAGAPWPEVRARWLGLARELHPDHHHDEDSAARLARINAAYAALASAHRRGGGGGDGGEHGRGEAAASTAAFTVEDFRPAVFEALVVASADVGDVTDTDEPFSLDLFVEGGFCHVELVPEAGGSVVTLDSDQVDAGEVRSAVIAALDRLGFTARPA